MARKTFRLIRSGALPGARNMALDEALAASAGAGGTPAVRLYRWRPWALSLGYFQRAEEADIEPYRRAGHGVTRRATGGGAIFHADELTYSVALPAGDARIPRGAEASYAWLHAAVAEALAAVGVTASPRGSGPPASGPDPFYCFARTAPIDLVAGGRKLVGSAQRRTRTSFLQHGSIPLSPNATAPGATSVAEARGGEPADPAALEEALGIAFARALGAEPVTDGPTAEEEARADAAERGKYGNRAWVLKPWKGPGRATGALPPPPPAHAPADGPAPLHVLRAEVTEEGLRVHAAVGGAHPLLPHARLAAVDAARVARIESRPLAVDRDPWDSTFRRSHFDAPAGGDAEASAPVHLRSEEEDLLVGLRYEGPEATVRLDAKRLNYRDLGPRRTGQWREDLRTLLASLLERAPRAARGAGAKAFLSGGAPPLAPDEASFLDALRRMAREP